MDTNTLADIRIGTTYFEVQDATEMACTVLNHHKASFDSRLEYRYTANDLTTQWLAAAILHVLYIAADKTLRGVATFLCAPHLDAVDASLANMTSTNHDPDNRYHWLDQEGFPTHVHPVIASIANDVRSKTDDQKAKMLQAITLALYRQPIISR